ncbi:aspartate ammonia-lyase [Acidaminococcus fermentans]|uniref:aspartate ammonia-lyase n=1 Tax=Acidaminococcus fermentans TaxID=905 RepID=UPI003079D214
MSQQKFERLESDSIGTKSVPRDAYYEVQSLRAFENFHITGQTTHPTMIRSLAYIKKACALANGRAGALKPASAKAIEAACDRILAGEYLDQFIQDPIQGGAGTSLNMNANEVIANIAIEILGGEKGDYSLIHPNDEVNRGQSTNDVIPTAGKLTVLFLLEDLYKSLRSLKEAFARKGVEFDSILKMGRTQLQDAVPIRLGQEFKAYATALDRGLRRIQSAAREMTEINMGGTAIGTGVNADPVYSRHIAQDLSQLTGFSFTQAADLIDATQNIDSFAAVSGSLKDCALSLSKISNDLRLMSSGPRTGLEEINLPARQNGSSIMPGKVNPVIPEVVSQVAFRIVGNDTCIAMAVEAGQLELNAFEPVIFYSLFQSIDILREAADTLRINCVEGITANKEHCQHLLKKSAGIVTALSPYIGYAKAAKLAKESLARNIPVVELARQRHYLSDKQLESVLDPYKMTTPAVR